jgi:hypothetical protein
MYVNGAHCACRACNHAKGARTVGQPSLSPSCRTGVAKSGAHREIYRMGSHVEILSPLLILAEIKRVGALLAGSST